MNVQVALSAAGHFRESSSIIRRRSSPDIGELTFSYSKGPKLDPRLEMSSNKSPRRLSVVVVSRRELSWKEWTNEWEIKSRWLEKQPNSPVQVQVRAGRHAFETRPWPNNQFK